MKRKRKKSTAADKEALRNKKQPLDAAADNTDTRNSSGAENGSAKKKDCGCGCSDPTSPSWEIEKPNSRYIGSHYRRGLLIGKKLYRPAHVCEEKTDEYIAANLAMAKYFKE